MNIPTTPHMERCIGGYFDDQEHDDKDIAKVVSLLVGDERERVFSTAMVSCLSARGVYKPERDRIPKRFHEVTTWKGQSDSGFLETLTRQSAQRLVATAGSTAKMDSEGTS